MTAKKTFYRKTLLNTRSNETRAECERWAPAVSDLRA